MQFLSCLLLFGIVSMATATDTNNIPLWSEPAPIDRETTEESDASLSIHLPEKPNGTAVIICPGGGYGRLVKKEEGTGIADWLNSHGITAFVLEYRLPKGQPLRPLYDAQRAIRIVRSRASEWNCHADQIGIIGFSAGGHLASMAATHFSTEDPSPNFKKVSARPDFAILIYPVISMGEATHQGSRKNLLGKNPTPENIQTFSSHLHITTETPPTFLTHAANDKPVPPTNSELFHEALKAHQVTTEYLPLRTGGHGLNGYQGPMWDAWQKRCLEWLAELGL